MTTDTSTSKPCVSNSFKRSNYFHGMLLTDRDFKDEQQYHLQKRWLLNRKLFGWGVVCGLDIECEAGQKIIKIKPGMALDDQGREIYVEKTFEADLSMLLDASRTVSATNDPCAKTTSTTETTDYYLTICYHEAKTDPIPVYVSGESCEQKTCEYSRYTEGFCVKLCPNCLSQPATTVEPEPCSKLFPCPESDANKSCVVLGKIRINTNTKTISECSLHACRRYVLNANLINYLTIAILKFLDSVFIAYDNQNNVFNWLNQTKLDETNFVEAVCEALQFVTTGNGKIFMRQKEAARPTIISGLTAAAIGEEFPKAYDPAEIEKLKQELEECKKSIVALEKRMKK